MDSTEDDVMFVAVTVGKSAALALRDAGRCGYALENALAFGPDYRERWPAGLLERTIVACVVVDVREADLDEALHEIVPFLRSRVLFTPHIALLAPAGLEDEWTVARMQALSRALHAPVIRSATLSGVAPGELATLVGAQFCCYGLLPFDTRDIEQVFKPPCSGIVYRWPLLSGSESGAVPDDLRTVLAGGDVTSVFLSFHGAHDLSLFTIDVVQDAVASLTGKEAMVLSTADIHDDGATEVFVAVVRAERSP